MVTVYEHLTFKLKLKPIYMLDCKVPFLAGAFVYTLTFSWISLRRNKKQQFQIKCKEFNEQRITNRNGFPLYVSAINNNMCLLINKI